MRRWIILGVLLVMVIAAVVGWQYKNYMDEEVEAKKEELWRRLTDRESSTFAECLKNQYLIPKCMDIQAAVDKAIGR